jgi:hypothetical protein
MRPIRQEKPDELNPFSGLRDQPIEHFVLRLPARPRWLV